MPIMHRLTPLWTYCQIQEFAQRVRARTATVQEADLRMPSTLEERVHLLSLFDQVGRYGLSIRYVILDDEAHAALVKAIAALDVIAARPLHTRG